MSEADSGHLVLAGAELTALSESERDRLRASHIGYILQTFNPLPYYTARCRCSRHEKPTAPVLADEAIALIREICRENNAALLIVSHDAEVLEQFEEAADFARVNRA